MMALRRYSFSQHFIDPERCFVSINKLENFLRKNKQTYRQTDRQTDRQTENSKPEATLITVDSRGERANNSVTKYMGFSDNISNYNSFVYRLLEYLVSRRSL